MSHFTVLVVTPQEPTDDVLSAALLPYHEYEADYREHGKGRPFDEFMDGWTDDKKNDAGEWGRWTNPNKQWDWWAVGGRWRGMLICKDGAPRDIARKDSLDLPLMAEQRFRRRCDTWDAAMADKARGANPEALDFIYGVKPNQTRDEFISTDKGFSTFAMLKDGKWYEKGDMGWWGMVANEKPEWPEMFAKLFADIPDDHYLTVVDCHI